MGWRFKVTAGVSHGLNTLRQLLRQRDGKLYLRACSIEDWPSLSFRGIHFFTGKNAREIQTRCDIDGVPVPDHLRDFVEVLRAQA